MEIYIYTGVCLFLAFLLVRAAVFEINLKAALMTEEPEIWKSLSVSFHSPYAYWALFGFHKSALFNRVKSDLVKSIVAKRRKANLQLICFAGLFLLVLFINS